MSYRKLAATLLFAMFSVLVLAATAHSADAPAQKMTADDIVGAIVVFHQQRPVMVIFTFKDGNVGPIEAESCIEQPKCAEKLKALMDSHHVLPVLITDVDGETQPDTKS